MKKILVTGGLGFIGSHFVDLLLEKGHEVFVYDARTYAANLDLFWDWDGVEGRQWVWRIQDSYAHIGWLEACRIFIPDVIVNFAAESHVDNSIESSGVFVDTNVFGTHELLRVVKWYKECHKKDVRFVQISTDEVYGHLGLEDAAFTEQTPISPRSPYSASKAAADCMVNAYHHTFGIDTVIVRCSNNYGPRQHKEKFIPKVIQSLLNKTDIPVYGTGQNIRDWVFVKDFAAGVYRAMVAGQTGEVYNFGGANEQTNLGIIEAISKVMRVQPRIKFVEDRKGHDFRYAMDYSKARTQLGWIPTTQFETGLAETISSYENHR